MGELKWNYQNYLWFGGYLVIRGMFSYNYGNKCGKRNINMDILNLNYNKIGVIK